ncbi:hypothetical protein WJX77_003390 [Trebouxia sp. C0004]
MVQSSGSFAAQGDARPDNIMVLVEACNVKQMQLIDMDWAGIPGNATLSCSTPKQLCGQRTIQGQLEQQVLDYVKQSASQGDSQAVLDAIDSFVSDTGMLINIGSIRAGKLHRLLSNDASMQTA